MSERVYIIPCAIFIKAGSPQEAYVKLCQAMPTHIGWESGDEWAVEGEDEPLPDDVVQAAIAGYTSED